MQHKIEKKNFIMLILGLLLVAAPSAASAMHVMEGYLPKGWALFWFALFIPFFVLGLRKLNTIMSKGKDIKLLLGLVAAFTFCLSALKIPSVVGSCSHPTGVGLGTVLFGPLPMVVVGAVVLLLQALLLAHGGITTLGANGFSMAVAGPFATYGIYKLLTKMNVNKKWALFFGAFLGDLVTYAVTSTQLGLAFPGTEGVAVAITKYLGIFMLTQLPIAVGEGILTVLVYNWIVENKEQLQVGKEVSL
jgi:cobalt/nickel transport system permease protein